MRIFLKSSCAAFLLAMLVSPASLVTSVPAVAGASSATVCPPSYRAQRLSPVRYRCTRSWDERGGLGAQFGKIDPGPYRPLAEKYCNQTVAGVSAARARLTNSTARVTVTIDCGQVI